MIYSCESSAVENKGIRRNCIFPIECQWKRQDSFSTPCKYCGIVLCWKETRDISCGFGHTRGRVY